MVNFNITMFSRNKKLLKLLCSVACIALISCASGQNSVKHAPVVPMQNYNTVTIAKFVSPDPAIGERVAARIAVRFAADGYSVTRRETLKKLSGKDLLISPELTPDDKALLKANGIKAVVYGTIDRYECQTQKEWTWTGFAPEKASFQFCRASFSIKVVDSVTGDIVWQTQGARSEKQPDETARMVLERVLTRIEDEIPKIK